MSADFPEDLPMELQSIQSRPLFVLRLKVRPLQVVGETPAGFRRIGVVTGGVFAGARLSGEVLEGGADWQAVRSDGSTGLDVRLVLKTADDALIAMEYRGVRHGPAEVIARLERGETVDPGCYYFRMAAAFQTAAPQYAWINKIAAVATGYRPAEGPVYSVFELL